MEIEDQGIGIPQNEYHKIFQRFYRGSSGEVDVYKRQISEKVNQEKSIEKGKKTSKAEFLKWFMPLLQALRDLGGSATPVEACLLYTSKGTGKIYCQEHC